MTWHRQSYSGGKENCRCGGGGVVNVVVLVVMMAVEEEN